MSKRQQSPQIQRELTRKQLSRAERDARNTRLLLLSVGGALGLVVLLIVFGVLRDSVFVPNEPIAIVGDQSILTREFQARVRLARLSLQQQYNLYVQFGLQDNANQVSQQLNDVQGIGSQVINQLIDEAIYRQSMSELGISVSPDDVQIAIEEGQNYFRNPPTPVPTSTPRPTFTPAPTLTGTAAITVTPAPTFTPQPTATPVTAEGFQELYQQQLGNLAQLGMDEADYRYFVESQLIAQKAQEVLDSRVVTMTDQVQFDYIAAQTQDEIDQVKQAIDKDGFGPVHSQILSNTFPITTVFAADLTFAPIDTLVDSFQLSQDTANAIFSTPISSTFGVISDTTGSVYYIGRVTGHEVRELSSSDLQSAQSKLIQAWLNERRQTLKVQVLVWEDRVPSDP